MRLGVARVGTRPSARNHIRLRYLRKVRQAVTGSNTFDASAFGDRLVRAIRREQLTQRKLAEAIGRPPSRVNDWIKGRRVPGVQDVMAIATALDVSTDWLLIGREARTPERVVVDELADLAPALAGVVARAERLARS